MGQLSPLEWIWHELNTVWIDKISMVRAPDGEQFAQVGDDLKSETGTLHEDGSFRWSLETLPVRKLQPVFWRGQTPPGWWLSLTLCESSSIRSFPVRSRGLKPQPIFSTLPFDPLRSAQSEGEPYKVCISLSEAILAGCCQRIQAVSSLLTRRGIFPRIT
jgi:hypothetical protein